jgi:hypothetical protein
MTRGLVWKELREQGAVLTALVVLGCAVLLSAAVLLDTTDSGRATELRSLVSAGRLGLIMLALTAGVVVGGTLFAGAREAGTFDFLDRLPGSRWRVWWRKVVTGGALVTVAAGMFLVVAGVGGLIGGETELTGWILLIGTVAYAAYGWGVLGSVFARTSLSACGAGLGLGTLLGFFLCLLFGVALTLARHYLGLHSYAPSDHNIWPVAFLTAGYSLIVLPWPVAAWLFTAPDRARWRAALAVKFPGVRDVAHAGWASAGRVRWGRGVRRLLWLARRQLTVPAAILFGGAMLAGIVLVQPPIVPIFAWPALSLIAGVLAGVVGPADEQNNAAFRFWGERRLPAGRLWMAKVLAGLGMTLAMLVALLVPMAITLAAGGLRQRPIAPLFAESGFPVATYLLVWPAYGFAFGHLAALLFRKAVVAGAVGIMTGGTLAALWLPSLLSGGIHSWQVFAVPVIALLMARMLAWPWATDRIGTRAPLTRVAAGSVTVLAVITAGLSYRVIEVPLVAEVEDDIRFAESLPTYDDQQAGRDLRRAAGLLSDVPSEIRNAGPNRPINELERFRQSTNQPDQPDRFAYVNELPAILAAGWPADRPELARWLDQMFATQWIEALQTAAAKPIGVLEDPNELTIDSELKNSDPVRVMNLLLLAQALRKQADGDPAAFPSTAKLCLATQRTAGHDTLLVPTFIARSMEWQVYVALDRWLERLNNRPDLLRTTLAAILEHDRRDPFDPRAVQLAQQVIVRNAIHAPGRWLPRYLDGFRPGWQLSRFGTASPAAEAQGALVSFAWTVPWEKERLRRVIGLANRPGRWMREAEYLRGVPAWEYLAQPDAATRPELVEGEKLILAQRRGAILKLALRLYEIDNGTLPASLTALVPRYLPAVPADPYDGKSFRYRISAGEQIERESRVEANQPPREPPGVEPFPLSAAQFTAVSGVVGGGACWPLVPGWMEILEVAGGMPGIAASSSDMFPPYVNSRARGAGPSRETVTVPAGQGIVWSIGPDGLDGGGVLGTESAYARDRGYGDLIYLIPRLKAQAEKKR